MLLVTKTRSARDHSDREPKRTKGSIPRVKRNAQTLRLGYEVQIDDHEKTVGFEAYITFS